MSNSGYIYVLINNSMENLVKVGKTSRDAESRAKELSSVTGVPTPFVVAFDAFFEDCTQAEDYVHRKLGQRGYRLTSNREFFQAPLKEVINAIIDAQQVLKSQKVLNNHPETHSVKTNSDESINLLDEKSDPWIELESLANYYLNSGNSQEGYRLYKQALNLGSKNAYLMLGQMTLRGYGCLEDKQEAIEYFRKGVNVGDGRCCAELSRCCFESKDCKAGLEWFEKYLQSNSLVSDPFMASHIFHCCFNLEIAHLNLNNLLLKYRNILSPMKEEIISYAINQINYVAGKYPTLKPLYLKVAHAIKSEL